MHAQPSLNDAIADLHGITRADAARLVDEILDPIIPILQRISACSRLDCELMIADQRRRAAEFVYGDIGDHIARCDVENALSWGLIPRPPEY